jgi:uncharacterized protein YjbI with pentapeptide repeats
MANPEHLDLLRQGVDVWNAWRSKEPSIRPDLTWANLREADLNGTDLNGAYLDGAHLSRAYLNDANLLAANLSCDPAWKNSTPIDIAGRSRIPS